MTPPMCEIIWYYHNNFRQWSKNVQPMFIGIFIYDHSYDYSFSFHSASFLL